MKSIKLHTMAAVFIAACFLIPAHAMAQWNIGASYQIRNDAPREGFGLHIQRQILKPIPLVYIGLRAHFSYFSQQKDNVNLGDVVTSREDTFYDFGLDAIGGIPLGFLKPYVGIGIGSDKYKIKYKDRQASSASRFYYNSFVGAALTVIPLLHPFIEYRFTPSSSPSFAKRINSNGRLVIGFSLVF